jgi:hypothetical protein
MSIVRSPVRSVVRSPVRGVFGGADTQTDLQRLLALSPSLLIWPANGAGWQGTSGGTLAASGQPLGLGADLSQLGGKTLGEWLAAPTTSELVTNGSFATATDWTLGTGWSISGGAAVATGVVPFGNELKQNLSVTSGRIYVISFDLTVTSGTVHGYLGPNGGTGDLGAYTTSQSVSRVVQYPGATAQIVFRADVAFTGTIDNISIRELPGNHLRAGTWASPSDAARGTFQNNAINFNGSAHYYSLLNAISITTNMTVVRAFKRASAGIVSQGLGAASAASTTEAVWFTDNQTYRGLGGVNTPSIVFVSTATGSFVQTSARNATTETIRRNGAVIGSGSALSVTGSLGEMGRRVAAQYNSGEISFLAVFPTELTGADLALVEQIAAATNGAVLA